MIAEIALRYAGTGALLVARPHGVPHVYVGPLTPSGRSVPRGRRAVCRAHTRRLSVLNLARLSGTRVCARCAACLTGTARRAAQPVTRTQYLQVFAGVTGEQLATALQQATTPVEVDQAAHLTLLLFGHNGCRRPHPTTGRSLHQLVTAARRRLQATQSFGGFDEHYDLAKHRRRADRIAAHEEREARIARIGIRNATNT